MTAYFYDRQEGCNKRFDHVEEMKFGIEMLDGTYQHIVQIFYNRSAETLPTDRYYLVMVHR